METVEFVFGCKIKDSERNGDMILYIRVLRAVVSPCATRVLRRRRRRRRRRIGRRSRGTSAKVSPAA